jgi:hypothetical protein
MMNPFLSKLNLPDDARSVVIHADDMGMGALRDALRRSA